MLPSSSRRRRLPPGAWVAVLVATGCLDTESLGDAFEFRPQTAHERYEYAFRRVGLEKSVLGHRWIAASHSALQQALPVETPFHEVGYFDPNEAESVGYAVRMERGQELSVKVETDSPVFVDLFRLIGDTVGRYDWVASADSGYVLDQFISRTGDYVLRIQPELLAGGRFEIRLINAASLSFPVAGRDLGAVRSWFNAPRDGGRRRHHGLDIFAPRGTPVVAAANGTVRSTRGNRLGGNVVWLRVTQGRYRHSLYYAHLDSVVARRGMNVRVGDTLGYVGNTGNARTTPPHLHFGIYSGGPTDPAPFLRVPPSDPPPLAADAEVVGLPARVARDDVRVRRQPGSRAEVITEVDRYVPLEVIGGTSRWYRVRLPEGTAGFVAANAVEPLDEPIEVAVIAAAAELVNRLGTDGVPTGRVGPGVEVPVLGRYGEYVLIRTATGRAGWLPEPGRLAAVTAGAGAGAGSGVGASTATAAPATDRAGPAAPVSTSGNSQN